MTCVNAVAAANSLTLPGAIVLGLAIVVVGALLWRVVDKLL